MPYLNAVTKEYQLTEVDVRTANPNTSFGSVFVAPEPFVWYFPSPEPTYNQITQSVREIAPELTEKGFHEQRWEVVDLDAEQIAVNQSRAAQFALTTAKAARQAEVDAIKVTTASGNTYDGDETAQVRMALAVVVLGATGGTMNWVLADNSIVEVTAAELVEALALSGAAQAAAWVKPYQ